MNPFRLFISPLGRTAPRTFVVAVILLYAASFLSQALLTLPGRSGVVAFGVAQAAVAWAWFALHAKRLRDADDSTLFALAFAILYALAVLLLLLFIEAVAGGARTGTRDDFAAGSVVSPVVVVLVIANFAGDASLGHFYYFMLALLALIVIPIVLALAVSIWAATRPTAQAAGTMGMMEPPGGPLNRAP
jgi:uncharacterized membrane protein YhaH (DUF805 family)